MVNGLHLVLKELLLAMLRDLIKQKLEKELKGLQQKFQRRENYMKITYTQTHTLETELNTWQAKKHEHKTQSVCVRKAEQQVYQGCRGVWTGA